jgi:hypothetical protein
MSYNFHKHISVHFLTIALLIVMVWKTLQKPPWSLFFSLTSQMYLLVALNLYLYYVHGPMPHINIAFYHAT